MRTPSFSSVLSSAVNSRSVTHQSQASLLHSTSTDCGISFRDFRLPVSSEEDAWDYVSLVSHIHLHIHTLILCVPVTPLRKLPLTLPSRVSPWNQQRPASGFLATARSQCGTPCSHAKGPKQVTFWWDACFLCSTERTIRLLLNLGFPCWLMNKHFHDFFISSTAIKGWSLELFPHSIFFFFVLPSQTALESNHAHLFQMEIILHLQDTNPSACVDRSSLWVSLLALSIYFHSNQLSLKTHKT